ncbi:MAG: hypothetical protein WDA09_08800 [Bacteriovoracaceae bacterium]
MNSVKIIVLNGYPQSGKDEFAKALRVKVYTETSFHFMNYSSISTVKEAARHFGASEARKTDKERRLYHDLKQAYIRYCDGPFREVVTLAKNLQNSLSNSSVIALHVREPEEILKLKNYFSTNCITVLIKRNTAKPANNKSDQRVLNYKYDYEVINNGSLEDLKEEVNIFFEKFLKDKL